MPTLSMTVAGDLANGLLSFYVKKGPLMQNIQDKPLLRILNGAKESFPGGKDTISSPVQGTFMSDTPGFLAGYSEDDQLTFAQSAGLLRSSYSWKEVHAGLEISWTELKKDGITMTDDNSMSEHKNAGVVRIVSGILQARLGDWGESWARSTNAMFWADGSQDAKAVPGLKAILTDTPATGTTGGLDRATYAWWRHRTLIGGDAITASEENQTLSKRLRSEIRQLNRFGGKPTTLLAGSKFIDALEMEVQAKGIYTQDGFRNEGKNDIGMSKISMRGVGTFEYDPTMDDLGESKRCYFLDTTKLKMRPMDGEDNKLMTPDRPYNYFVFFKSMTWTGALECTQLNANGIYEVTNG